MQTLRSCCFSRRRFLAAGAATVVASPFLRAQAEAPVAPVAIARCWQYDASVYDAMAGMFDLLGGLGGLVRGKTVGIKINLTGAPEIRLDGAPVEVAQWVHWAVIGILVRQLAEAGAVRIRLMESAGDGIAPLEEYMARAGWDPGYFSWAALSAKLEFENTNYRGSGSAYSRLTVPYGGYLFPAFDLNHSYADCDVFVSLTKLKQHVRAGITLSMKNCFGMLPLSVYGTNAGVDEPAETPNLGYRGEVMHMGWRNPSLSAPQEVNPDSPRDTGYRLPRVITDIVAARPVHLAVIDGIETMAGAEGPWTQGVSLVKPGVLIAGLNPVCTDAVAMAVMGLDPMAASNTGVFRGCDNMLEFAESVGIGTRDLSRIDVRGERIQDVVFPFGPLGDPTAI